MPIIYAILVCNEMRRNIMKVIKRILYWSVILLLIAAVCFSGYQIWNYYHQDHQASTLTDTMIEDVIVILPATEPPYSSTADEYTETYTEKETQQDETIPLESAPISVDFDALKQQYPDAVGWLYCPDTIIHYPIAQGSTNSTYLRHLLDGTYNSNGSIFLDYRNDEDFSDANSIIYGHNMHTDAMFGTLPEYQNQHYYDAHPFIYLLTPYGNFKLHLLSGTTTTTDCPILQPDLSGAELIGSAESFVDDSDFQSLSVFDPEKNIITLVTCEYDTDDSRYVLLCQAELLS